MIPAAAVSPARVPVMRMMTRADGTPVPCPPPARRPATGAGAWPQGDSVIDGVPVLGRVLGICRDRGIPLRDLVAAYRDPEQTWRARENNGNMRLRGPVAVLVADDSEEVIAITSRGNALRVKAQTKHVGHGTPKAKGTGGGSTMPTSVKDLLDRAHFAGLRVERATRHYLLSNPAESSGVMVTVPKTPSDHRSLPNAVMQVRKVLGVDLARRSAR